MITLRKTLEELINVEAHRLALEDLMEENISPDKSLPNDIASQLETLLSTTDFYHSLARKNVLAQKSAYDSALRSIGLDPIEVDPLELDL